MTPQALRTRGLDCAVCIPVCNFHIQSLLCLLHHSHIEVCPPCQIKELSPTCQVMTEKHSAHAQHPQGLPIVLLLACVCSHSRTCDALNVFEVPVYSSDKTRVGNLGGMTNYVLTPAPATSCPPPPCPSRRCSRGWLLPLQEHVLMMTDSS